MDDAVRIMRVWALGGMIAVGLIAVLGGCAVTPLPLSSQVREICGVPKSDLSNIEAYQTCVYTVLDTHSEEIGPVVAVDD